jgi:hydroxyacylglutathione hydrolase
VFEGGSFGRVDFPGCDPQALVRSLEKLATLDPVAFYPGHMRPVERGARGAILESLDNARLMLG